MAKKTVLPSNDICIASRHAAISPDGKIIVWIRNYSEFWITQKEEKKWTKPPILIEKFSLPSQRKQIKNFRISNTDLAFALWIGQTYLCTRLNKDKALYQIQ